MAFSRVQTGTGTIAAGAGSGTATIASAVDTAKTILFVSYRVSTATPNEGMVAHQLTDSTTVTCFRNATTGSPVVNFRWYAIEFSSGVTVQHGNFALSGTSTDQAITAVGSLSNTFPLCSFKGSGSAHDGSDGYEFELTTTSNLQVRTASSVAGSTTCYYQIVEYTGASVQKKTLSFATTDVSKTDATLTAVTLARTFVVLGVSHGTASGDMGAMAFRARMGSTTSVIVERDHHGSNSATALVHVVELPSDDIQQIEEVTFDIAVSASSKSKTLTTTLTDSANAAIFVSGSPQSFGETGRNTNDTYDDCAVTVTVDSTTQVTATRATAVAFTCDATGYVIEFKTGGNGGGGSTPQLALLGVG